jgi:O-methyltransferase
LIESFARRIVTYRTMLRYARRIGVSYARWDLPDKPLYQPMFSPWTDPAWRKELQLDGSTTLVSADRIYVLERLLRQALASVPGDIAECGVYRGGSARILADIASRADQARRVLLFDTFAGMPDTSKAFDYHERGDFADTSLEAVRALLAPYPNCEFYPGFVPQTFAGLEERRFAFVHVDLDIHDAIAAASAFFYPRLTAGGFFVYDDYGFPSCPGARRAVDAFFADKPEEPLVLPTGQCIVFKAPAAG